MRRVSTAGIVAFMLVLEMDRAAIAGESRSVDWPVYGGQSADDHYSPLSQINKKNVAKLRVAWQFDTGEKGGLQVSPIVVGRVLYGYTPSQKVIALDAASGRLLWTFDSGVEGTQPARGVTYWTDGKERRLFAGVMNYLYALDPATGKPIDGFGEHGRIDLRKDLRGDYRLQSIALTTPGVIYQDLIIVGGRNPETHPAPPGDIRAFDVHTGELRWSFHTIPHPGEAGYETWPKNGWTYGGAANNWAGMAVDQKRGIVYAPTGSAVADFYGGDRVGDDLFADTLLALDAETGKRLWDFQGVHHDVWDRDFPSPPSLVTVMRDGRTIDAVAQTTKQAYLYLFDRVTGKPLFPIQELPYPASSVPEEVVSPTQPKPVKPEPFGRQALTEEMLTNRSPAAHAWAVSEFKKIRSEGQFVPFSLERQTIVFPGFDGGAEWGGSAVDIASGVLYVNENEMAWLGGLVQSRASAGEGEVIYGNQCGVCHGSNRAGSPPAFPSLVDIGKRLNDPQIAKTIQQGKGRMPSFPNLDEEQLKTLLKYLETPAAIDSTGDKQEMASTSAVQERAVDPQGESSYRAHCAICHGDRLEGIAPAFPMLVGVGQRQSRAQIESLIHSGKGRMPGFPKLQDGELNALLRYLAVSPVADASGLADEQLHSTDGAGGPSMKYQFTGYHKFLDPEGYPAIAPPWGTLNAIDLNSGEYLWKIPFGAYPELTARGMADTGSENYGGPIVTAGGLLFIGATVYDKKFHAYDSRTGALLWETTLPFAGVATPATYMVDGRQYVVIACGGGRDPKSPSGGTYVAFALR